MHLPGRRYVSLRLPNKHRHTQTLPEFNQKVKLFSGTVNELSSVPSVVIFVVVRHRFKLHHQNETSRLIGLGISAISSYWLWHFQSTHFRSLCVGCDIMTTQSHACAHKNACKEHHQRLSPFSQRVLYIYAAGTLRWERKGKEKQSERGKDG